MHYSVLPSAVICIRCDIWPICPATHIWLFSYWTVSTVQLIWKYSYCSLVTCFPVRENKLCVYHVLAIYPRFMYVPNMLQETVCGGLVLVVLMVSYLLGNSLLFLSFLLELTFIILCRLVAYYWGAQVLWECTGWCRINWLYWSTCFWTEVHWGFCWWYGFSVLNFVHRTAVVAWVAWVLCL